MRQSPKSSLWSQLPVMVGSGDIKETASIERMVCFSEDSVQFVPIKGTTRKQLPRS